MATATATATQTSFNMRSVTFNDVPEVIAFLRGKKLLATSCPQCKTLKSIRDGKLLSVGCS